MKTKIILGFLLFLITACEREYYTFDESIEKSNVFEKKLTSPGHQSKKMNFDHLMKKINGRWKLIATYHVDENNASWIKTNKKEVLNFDSNNNVVINTITAEYVFDGIRLNISFPNNKTYSENYLFEKNYLILTNTRENCPEGCDRKYILIPNKEL